MTATIVPLRKKFDVPEFSDIRHCWDMVKPGIEFVLKQNPHLTYMPEDVFSECVTGKSMLFMSSLGFVVLTVQTDPFTKENGATRFVLGSQKYLKFPKNGKKYKKEIIILLQYLFHI